MKSKFILMLVLLTFSFISCVSENEKINENNFSKRAKINANKIATSYQFKSFMNKGDFLSKNENSEYVITEEKLKELLDLTNYSEEEKAKVTVSFVNNIIKNIIEVKKQGGLTEDYVKSFSMSGSSEQTVFKILKDDKIQSVESLISLNTIPMKEQAMLGVVSDFRNDYLINNNGELLNRRSCLMSGPRGSGYMDCGTVGGIVGGLIGGSCCGILGAGIGAGVGYLVGNFVGEVS